MKQPANSKQRLIWGLILAVAWISVGVLLYRTHGGFTAQELVNYRPDDPFLSCLVMLGLFLLKSVDFLMHSGVLYAANGIMFPLPLALLFNLLGAAVMITPCFFLGRSQGAPVLAALHERHPKLALFDKLPVRGEFLIAVLLRTTGIPLHVGDLYMGASQISYGRYLLGSLLGLLPVLLPYTVLGAAASDPSSPLFIGSIVAEITVSLLAILLYAHLKKKAASDKSSYVN